MHLFILDKECFQDIGFKLGDSNVESKWFSYMLYHFVCCKALENCQDNALDN